MSFDEVRFPVGVGLGAVGGPRRRTEVALLGSGFEERNALWVNSRRSYSVSYTGAANDIANVITFFEARTGKLRGFRFKDWSDFRSGAPQSAVANTDQSLGTGDGSTTTFQLQKTYLSSAQSWVRKITKPVSGTVTVAVNGVAKTLNTHYTLDPTTGLITFTGGNTPPNGQAVTAGFEFDVPCRFDTDDLDITLHDAAPGYISGTIANLQIVEIRI